MFTDNPRALFREVQSRFDAHGVQFLTDASADAPYVLNGYQNQQSALTVNIGQVHYPARLALPFLGGVVCQLGEGFRLRDANPDSQVRTLQNCSADTVSLPKIAYRSRPRYFPP